MASEQAFPICELDIANKFDTGEFSVLAAEWRSGDCYTVRLFTGGSEDALVQRYEFDFSFSADMDRPTEAFLSVDNRLEPPRSAHMPPPGAGLCKVGAS